MSSKIASIDSSDPATADEIEPKSLDVGNIANTIALWSDSEQARVAYSADAEGSSQSFSIAIPGSDVTAALSPSASQPASPTAPSAPGLNTTWAGSTESGAGGYSPPDNVVTEGIRNVITMVNDQINIYSRAGVLQLSQSLNTFFGVSGTNFVFDPRVTYDEYSGRFICTADDQTGTNSAVHIKVSKTSNPSDGWWSFDVNTKVGNSWLDYPQLAIDAQNIYITGNMFDLTSQAQTGSRLYVLNKNILENGGVPAVASFDLFQDITPSSFQTTLYTAAQTYGAEAGLNGTFLVAYNQSNSGSDSVDIIRTDGTVGSLQFFNHNGGTGETTISVGNISDADPAGARQQGSALPLDDGDDRIQNVIWRDNKLYAITEIRIGTGASAHDVVHWFEFDTSNLNNITLFAQGNVDFGANYDTYYGHVAVDTQGNMIIGYSISGPNTYGSAQYVFVVPGGPSTDFSAYQYGTAPYTEVNPPDTIPRWGDYSGMAIDPTDNRGFVVFNQYATNTNSWATTVGEYNAAPTGGVHVKTNDFTGSGTSDFLWQNNDGTITFWKPSGFSIPSTGFTLNPGSSWHAIGTGDFNGDTYADALFQNNDGSVAVWQIKDNNVIGGGLGAINPGNSWSVKGSGDFNTDGKSDILLQNVNGSIVEWFMNGSNIIGGGQLGVNPGSNWHVFGSGDFNADGRGDIVLQDANTGDIVIWDMNGLNITGGGQLSVHPGTTIQIKGIGDFNGDGISDLLLRDVSSGAAYVWEMGGAQGLNIIGGGLVGNPGLIWNLIGAGDFNGDGKSDILWQNVDGTLDYWSMNGSTNMVGSLVGSNPGTSWHAIAH